MPGKLDDTIPHNIVTLGQNEDLFLNDIKFSNVIEYDIAHRMGDSAVVTVKIKSCGKSTRCINEV